MAGNGHHRRLDRIEAQLPTVRPSAEVLEQEMDRLIEAYERRNAGDRAVTITPRWPYSDLDRWVAEIIEELAEGSV